MLFYVFLFFVDSTSSTKWVNVYLSQYPLALGSTGLKEQALTTRLLELEYRYYSTVTINLRQTLAKLKKPLCRYNGGDKTFPSVVYGKSMVNRKINEITVETKVPRTFIVNKKLLFTDKFLLHP